jgi:hypothetical protein
MNTSSLPVSFWFAVERTCVSRRKNTWLEAQWASSEPQSRAPPPSTSSSIGSSGPLLGAVASSGSGTSLAS